MVKMETNQTTLKLVSIMENTKKTIDECFSTLIKNKRWHKGSPFVKQMATYHKNIFKKGKLSDNIKRIYLEAAGYELIQPELWEKKIESKIEQTSMFQY